MEGPNYCWPTLQAVSFTHVVIAILTHCVPILSGFSHCQRGKTSRKSNNTFLSVLFTEHPFHALDVQGALLYYSTEPVQREMA